MVQSHIFGATRSGQTLWRRRPCKLCVDIAHHPHLHVGEAHVLQGVLVDLCREKYDRGGRGLHGHVCGHWDAVVRHSELNAPWRRHWVGNRRRVAHLRGRNHKLKHLRVICDLSLGRLEANHYWWCIEHLVSFDWGGCVCRCGSCIHWMVVHCVFAL